MAFDGIVVANLVKELNETLSDGRIYKIAQPESDEIILTVKSNRTQYRLLLSASASLPLAYITETKKTNPMTAPNFCMLLRKHIGNARIISITQPALERVICFQLEHLNELGDLCEKKLIIELMDRHSNLIFCDNNNKIIDSIKHVPAYMSSVREVLPGRDYFIPETQHKKNPLDLTEAIFLSEICNSELPVIKALYSALMGISSLIAKEIAYRAKVDENASMASLTDSEKTSLMEEFFSMMDQVKTGTYAPAIVYKEKVPVEFSSLPLTMYKDCSHQDFSSISQLLETYYAEKSLYTRMHQKSTDLRRVVQNALERVRKKYKLQQKQLKDTEKKDKYRVYGELINTYGYGVDADATSFEALNYYTNETITIPLDNTITPGENAKKYFDRYNKLKRTAEALDVYLKETASDLEHLESISTALDMAAEESDLAQLKEELIQYGYVKRKHVPGKKKKIVSKPLHFYSSDGYDIYVGKNNFQNDELTFQMAVGSDWWFHAKGQPGSHVIVKARGNELPDATFEEAARLAAHYSAGKNAPKVEIDYIQKKHVKKTNGGKPGFVIYHTNYSMMVSPDISDIKKLTE